MDLPASGGLDCVDLKTDSRPKISDGTRFSLGETADADETLLDAVGGLGDVVGRAEPVLVVVGSDAVQARKLSRTRPERQ